MGKVVHIDGSCIEWMAQAANKAMAGFRADIGGAVLLVDGGLLKLRTSFGNGECVNRHRFILNPHQEPETIGEQSADHLLHSASYFAFLKTGRDGVGGRFRFDIVLLNKGPVGKRGKARRGVDRHVVSVTQ